ncbi:hypothetical protein BC834DRAFT_147477 [Gloeopeniophorella convolvens]|nr:hypothetical protein BC834DRAFT_147477 [Gloeopeniophorella convolvens]
MRWCCSGSGSCMAHLAIALLSGLGLNKSTQNLCCILIAACAVQHSFSHIHTHAIKNHAFGSIVFQSSPVWPERLMLRATRLPKYTIQRRSRTRWSSRP